MLATTAPTNMVFAGTYTTTNPEHAGGLLMDHQNLLFVVWLGIAVPALVWGEMSVWHTRRLLRQAHPKDGATHIQLVPVPVAESTTISEVTSSPVAPSGGRLTSF